MEGIGLSWVEFQLANRKEGGSKIPQKGTSRDKEVGCCPVHVEDNDVEGRGYNVWGTVKAGVEIRLER